MGWFILSYLFSTLISLVSIGRLSEQEKDLEILLLRHHEKLAVNVTVNRRVVGHHGHFISLTEFNWKRRHRRTTEVVALMPFGPSSSVTGFLLRSRT